MTDEEVEWIKEKISESTAVPFITSESDIEGYFLLPEHLAALLERPVHDVSEWLDSLALEHHNQLSLSFTRREMR